MFSVFSLSLQYFLFYFVDSNLFLSSQMVSSEVFPLGFWLWSIELRTWDTAPFTSHFTIADCPSQTCSQHLDRAAGGRTCCVISAVKWAVLLFPAHLCRPLAPKALESHLTKWAFSAVSAGPSSSKQLVHHLLRVFTFTSIHNHILNSCLNLTLCFTGVSVSRRFSPSTWCSPQLHRLDSCGSTNKPNLNHWWTQNDWEDGLGLNGGDGSWKAGGSHEAAGGKVCEWVKY